MSLIHTPKPLSSLSASYGCMIADNPWPELGGGKIKRGADRHYPTMTIKEMCDLPVAQIGAPDCHLYLWITNKFLAEGAHVTVARAWNFRPVSVLTWRKLGRFGLGQYWRGTTEHVIFCVRGAPPYRTNPQTGKRAQGVTDFGDCEVIEIEGAWWEEPRPGAHSKKPTKIHEWAELVSHGPYLELFAREGREGWESWGNQAPEADNGSILD